MIRLSLFLEEINKQKPYHHYESQIRKKKTDEE